MKEYEEKAISDIQGTIIDIETIGDFKNIYRDSRRYKNILSVIFGYMDDERLHIYCTTGKSEIQEFKMTIKNILRKLNNPFYAFNVEFETCVFYHHLGIEEIFERELNLEKYEKKSNAIRMLNIPNYDDPFHDNGLLCKIAWENSEFDKAVAHNRACLLKERDILLKRGFRTPDRIKLTNSE
jgi:hypothetical protein